MVWCAVEAAVTGGLGDQAASSWPCWPARPTSRAAAPPTCCASCASSERRWQWPVETGPDERAAGRARCTARWTAWPASPSWRAGSTSATASLRYDRRGYGPSLAAGPPFTIAQHVARPAGPARRPARGGVRPLARRQHRPRRRRARPRAGARRRGVRERRCRGSPWWPTDTSAGAAVGRCRRGCRRAVPAPHDRRRGVGASARGARARPGGPRGTRWWASCTTCAVAAPWDPARHHGAGGGGPRRDRPRSPRAGHGLVGRAAPDGGRRGAGCPSRRPHQPPRRHRRADRHGRGPGDGAVAGAR